MLQGFFKKSSVQGVLLAAAILAALLFGAGMTPIHAQGTNLNNSVTGILKPVNGGNGLNTSSATGCVKFTAGVPSLVSCSSGGSSIVLKTNGNVNSDQTQLNLTAGSGITLSNISGITAITALGITELTGDGTAVGPGEAEFTLTAVSTAGTYTVGTSAITIDDKGRTLSIGPAFAISTFTCSTCGTYEIGATIASPTNFTASYTSTPTSASIGDGTNSTTLSTPFTSGSLAFSYTANTTFTLTAVGATTKTSQQGIAFQNCTFSGLSTGGTATGVTASGSGTGNKCASETATLAGITGTLSSNGLGDTTAGKSFTFPTPGGSYISLILTGGCGHTLTVGGFVTVFKTFALTYTNILGGTQTNMCVYTSPAPASLSTTVVVQSL